MARLAHLLAASAAALTMAQAGAMSVDLGLAGQFNVLTFGGFSGYNGDTEGLLAAGGNVGLGSWAVNAHDVAPYAGYALIAGGDFTGLGSGSVHGNSFIGGTVGGSAFSLGTIGGGATPLDFGSLKTTLGGLSSTVASAAATGSAEYKWGGTYLTGSNRDVEVFNLDGSQLGSATYLSSTGIKSGATVIVNISGQSVSLTDSFDIAGSNLLLNFYQASSLSFAHIGIDGSVLAPGAAVTGISGNIKGTLVAQSFASGSGGGFEFHDLHFSPAQLAIPSAVPEPGQWLLLVAGLLLTPMLVRRRREARRAGPRR